MGQPPQISVLLTPSSGHALGSQTGTRPHRPLVHPQHRGPGCQARMWGRAYSPALGGGYGEASQVWGQSSPLGTGPHWCCCCEPTRPHSNFLAHPRPLTTLPASDQVWGQPCAPVGTWVHSRARLREPPAQQAPGWGRTPEHQQQQINEPPECAGAVMETVPWKPFPADGKPPVAPTVPWPAPLGAPRGPPPASTSPEAHSQRRRGDHACQIGPGRVGEGMDVARQPASSIAMATPPIPAGMQLAPMTR